jgi:Tol biopolymer transport system component
LAHGLPWDVWLIDPRGGEPRQLAALGLDDPSVVWSPDGRQLFVYSGTGSALIDVATHAVARYDYLAGYGAAAWMP